MARPIRETPILTGVDADRFMNEMNKVESMDVEMRTANRVRLQSEFQKALKTITICL